VSATIRVGTCAWVEKGLIADWYPSTATTAEARLRFYAEHYDTVEVDSSYYAIPAERTVYNWGQRTPPGFVFHIKAFGLMTGHRVRPEQLPADLRTLIDEVTPHGYVVPSDALRDRGDDVQVVALTVRKHYSATPRVDVLVQEQAA
jgi:uncharacterized protein YecE (DUF72 family)